MPPGIKYEYLPTAARYDDADMLIPHVVRISIVQSDAAPVVSEMTNWDYYAAGYMVTNSQSLPTHILTLRNITASSTRPGVVFCFGYVEDNIQKLVFMNLTLAQMDLMGGFLNACSGLPNWKHVYAKRSLSRLSSDLDYELWVLKQLLQGTRVVAKLYKGWYDHCYVYRILEFVK